MIRYAWAAIAAAFFLAAPVSAQEEFCALPTKEMMQALNGTWQLKQGAGVAVSGAGAIPLPPQAPLTLQLEYDLESAVAELTGAGPAERMVLVPTIREDVPEIDEYLHEAEKEGFLGTDTGCDYDPLPLMIGTNLYSLSSENEALIKGGAGGMLVLSLLSGQKLNFCEKSQIWRSFGGPVVDPNNDFAKKCVDDLRENGFFGQGLEVDEGSMAMTLLIKFQSRNSGAGTLFFEGQQGGYKFAAKAAVTLAR